MIKTLSKLFILSTILFLSACDGNNSNINTPTPPVEDSYIISLQWDMPTEYEDGSPIGLDEIKEYKVYYGDDSNFLKQSKNVLIVEGGQNTTASIMVSKGIWYFAVTAIDVNEHESDLSNIVTYVF